MQKITISKLRAILKESLYKPREKYRFITELQNPEYCMLKAMELINKARSDKKDRQILLRQAISLLATARVQLDETTTRSKNTKRNHRVSKNEGLVSKSYPRKPISTRPT